MEVAGRIRALDPAAPGDRTSAFRHAFGERTRYERSSSIDRVFAQRALETPSAIAAVGLAGALSYAQLERSATRFAGQLRRRGVRAGSNVGVALGRTLDLPVALLAILKTGAAYVPLDLAYPAERLAMMIDDASIEVVVCAEGGASFAGTRALCVAPFAGDDGSAGERQPEAAQSAGSLAYVTYTSGSTGAPKGVAVEHRGVVRLVRNTDYVRIDPSDTLLHCAPLAFDASTFEIWGALLNGARLALPPSGLLGLDELATSIRRFEVSVLFLTSALFARLVELADLTFPSLRCLITGGEVLSVPHARRFLDALPGCRLLNAYGPTENTTFSTMWPVSRTDLRGAVPIGRPIANSSAHVLDENLRPVPPGASGELCVGGDGVARGYLNRPELSAERFVPDPFDADPAARLYRTGDRARFRADGALEFLGRSDGQVKVRGHRVETGEIESVLRAHPIVREAAVVAAVEAAQTDLVAHVSLEPEAFAEEREVRAFLARKLPAYMLPRRIFLHARLPLNENGKVDRTALAAASAARAPASASAAPRFSRDPLSLARERAVAEIWRDALGAGRAPSLDENFFDAGGDSLRLLTVHARLCDRFGVKLKTTDLFEHTTIRALAAFLEARGASA